ncbi:MAG: hypothetical protein RIS70_2655 [Planctomycetota bacterium]|jgi:hypothetical protein
MLRQSLVSLCSFALLLVGTLACPSFGANINVPADHTTISEAITAADPGDTIVVDAGVYDENLTIQKSLTLIGPNNSVAALPESGWVRVAEAVVGSTTNPGNRVTIDGNGSTIEVHISGFKFVGPAMGDAASGIAIYSAQGSISNNYFDHLTYTAVSGGADIYTQSGPGPWIISGNRHDGRGYKYYSGDGDEGTYGYSAINAWYLDNVTIHGNRIERYGFAGIQLEATDNAQITSNYIKDVGASGIQVGPYCEGKIVLQGNTVDHASAAFESWFDSGLMDVDYGWAGIRIWQVASSDGLGTEVLNNLVINTPQRVGAIGFVGEGAQTLAKVEANSIATTNSDGLLHYNYAVRATEIASGKATIRLWASEDNAGDALASTTHNVGEKVVVTGLGPDYDGEHEITEMDTWYDGYGWYYKTISFHTTVADQALTDVYRGAAASWTGVTNPIPAADNYWGGSAPDDTGASLNSAGAAAMVAPWIKSYTAGSAPTGFIDGIGFWPTDIVSAPCVTTLTFDGPFLDADGVTGTTLYATLSSTDPNCVAGQTVVFTLDEGVYTASGTTDASGKVSVTFANLPVGAYDVQVEFAGTAECVPSSDEGTLTVASAGDTANGGGWYKVTTNPVTRASFGFVAQSKTNKRTGVTTVTGELVWICHKHYRLKSSSIDSIAYTTVSGYSKSAQLGGWGELSVWVPDASPDGGYWGVVGPVAFVATVCDGGQTNIGTKKKPKYVDAPDAFGIQFPATGLDIEPGESVPIQLSGGQIKLK